MTEGTSKENSKNHNIATRENLQAKTYKLPVSNNMVLFLICMKAEFEGVRQVK